MHARLRSSVGPRIVRGLLIAGVVVGFGTGLHHLHHRRDHADALARTCVDAAQHGAASARARSALPDRYARRVAERCAALAAEPSP